MQFTVQFFQVICKMCVWVDLRIQAEIGAQITAFRWLSDLFRLLSSFVFSTFLKIQNQAMATFVAFMTVLRGLKKKQKFYYTIRLALSLSGAGHKIFLQCIRSVKMPTVTKKTKQQQAKVICIYTSIGMSSHKMRILWSVKGWKAIGNNININNSSKSQRTVEKIAHLISRRI